MPKFPTPEAVWETLSGRKAIRGGARRSFDFEPLTSAQVAWAMQSYFSELGSYRGEATRAGFVLFLGSISEELPCHEVCAAYLLGDIYGVRLADTYEAGVVPLKDVNGDL